ncbi:helix-turn-helix domain-containing protein [Saccharothrix lopnurensis]|uniref:Helix-turn-helix domain-containing protein n=1 Tax=Saccharothrix lopnurensis TaxID=1670621 RepID=A0ABW1PDS7_9PSEU
MIGCPQADWVVEVEGAYRLSPAEREVLRLRVVAALESGQVEGYRQAAEVFGVSEHSVDTWWRAYRRDGRDGLTTYKGRPGPAEMKRDAHCRLRRVLPLNTGRTCSV